ncbi:flavodoxin [Merdimonas faecis]|uniref:flavodoxin n=1 Tax=Merdimonas faecis TaxID=1653435 RepID=UPI00320B064F
MKKVISILAAGTMTMGLLAGCGSSSESTEEDTSGQAAQEDSADEGSTDAAASDEAETSGNVLIAYYSATGNTEAVANMIADATEGDLFELEPTEPYTDDDLNWSDDNSRVSQEHENEDQRDVELVSTTPENWDSYDTVFIGYPIWWGIAAWPVDHFVEDNDFTGKTVIPFCTSASSGIGDSGELLADMAGTGDWQEGQRFRSSVSDEDVVAWVESLE